MPTSPSPSSERLRHSQSSRNPFHAGHVFRGFPVHAFATACQVARPPVRIRPMCSASEGFYFQASNGSVALPVAGYNYNSDWTPLLAGLAPAGMAASLAAPEPYVRLSRIRLPPRVCDGESGRIRSSAFVTRAWLWVQYVLCWCVFPLVPALRSTDSAAFAPADASAVGFLRFVRRLHCYYDEVRLLVSVHHWLRLLAFPMRTAVHTQHASTAARYEISQVPVRSLCT